MLLCWCVCTRASCIGNAIVIDLEVRIVCVLSLPISLFFPLSRPSFSSFSFSPSSFPLFATPSHPSPPLSFSILRPSPEAQKIFSAKFPMDKEAISSKVRTCGFKLPLMDNNWRNLVTFLPPSLLPLFLPPSLLLLFLPSFPTFLTLPTLPCLCSPRYHCLPPRHVFSLSFSVAVRLWYLSDSGRWPQPRQLCLSWCD